MYENLLSCRITYTDEECFEAFNKTQNLAKEMYGSDIVDDNLMCDEHITRLAEIQWWCGEYVRLAYGSFANKEQLTCFTETIQENLWTTGDIKQFFEQKMQTIKDKTPTQDQDTEFLNCQEIQLEYVDDTLLCLQNIEKIDQQSTALEQQQTREQTMEQISLCTENYQTRKEAATNTYDNPHKQLVQACWKIVSYHNQKEWICDIERNNQYAYLNADTDPNGLQEFWFNKTQCYRDVINSPKTIETLYKQKIWDWWSLNICANINQCAADEVCHQQINRCIKSGLKLQTKNELEDFIKSNTIASMWCAHSWVCSISTSTIGWQEGTSWSKTLYYKNWIPVRDLLEKYNQTDIQQRTE